MAGGDLHYYGMEHPGNHVMLGIKDCEFFFYFSGPTMDIVVFRGVSLRWTAESCRPTLKTTMFLF